MQQGERQKRGVHRKACTRDNCALRLSRQQCMLFAFACVARAQQARMRAGPRRRGGGAEGRISAAHAPRQRGHSQLPALTAVATSSPWRFSRQPPQKLLGRRPTPHSLPVHVTFCSTVFCGSSGGGSGGGGDASAARQASASRFRRGGERRAKPWSVWRDSLGAAPPRVRRRRRRRAPRAWRHQWHVLPSAES